MSRQHFGRYDPLEEIADELIRESFEGITKYSAKSMILTPWKMAMREQREVLTSNGTPERHIRSGMYNRCANTQNPELNSRMGIAQARSSGSGISRTYVQYHGSEEQTSDNGSDSPS